MVNKQIEKYSFFAENGEIWCQTVKEYFSWANFTQIKTLDDVKCRWEEVGFLKSYWWEHNWNVHYILEQDAQAQQAHCGHCQAPWLKIQGSFECFFARLVHHTVGLGLEETCGGEPRSSWKQMPKTNWNECSPILGPVVYLMIANHPSFFPPKTQNCSPDYFRIQL